MLATGRDYHKMTNIIDTGTISDNTGIIINAKEIIFQNAIPIMMMEILLGMSNQYKVKLFIN